MNPVQVYESLFKFEKSKDKSNVGYPIHKKLNFETKEVNDIYDWLMNNFNFFEGAKVLDAGCGVGYGSLKLATERSIQVTGISISPSEIEKANYNSSLKGLNEKADFKVANFEEAPGENYDFIIAVESLKHSLDLKKSLLALKNKLSAQGTIIIVEDFYQRNSLTQKGRMLMKDWSLINLYSLEDYTRFLENGAYVDLTNLMPTKSYLGLQVKRLLLGFMTTLSFLKQSKVYQVFRGGILLDLLYRDELMKYAVFSWSKKETNA